MIAVLLIYDFISNAGQNTGLTSGAMVSTWLQPLTCIMIFQARSQEGMLGLSDPSEVC